MTLRAFLTSLVVAPLAGFVPRKPNPEWFVFATNVIVAQSGGKVWIFRRGWKEAVPFYNLEGIKRIPQRHRAP